MRVIQWRYEFYGCFQLQQNSCAGHFCGTSSAHSKVPREVQRTANKVTNSDWKIACEPICGHNKTRIPTYELQGLLRMQILHFIKRKLMKIHYSASVKCSCYMFFHGTVRTAKHSTRRSQAKKNHLNDCVLPSLQFLISIFCLSMIAFRRFHYFCEFFFSHSIQSSRYSIITLPLCR